MATTPDMKHTLMRFRRHTTKTDTEIDFGRCLGWLILAVFILLLIAFKLVPPEVLHVLKLPW